MAICGTVRGSFAVLVSFAVQFGDHLRFWDHLRTRTDPPPPLPGHKWLLRYNHVNTAGEWERESF